MSPRSTEPPAFLAVAAGASGLLALVLLVGGLIWMGIAAPGEAVFAVIPTAGAVFSAVGAIAMGAAILALMKRATPRWMAVTGLLASAIPLLYGLCCLGFVLSSWLLMSGA